jgi:peptidyl-prolyl cis-trans isomerase SurA
MPSLALAVVLACLPTVGRAQSTPTTELNRVVAVVNNDVVLQTELDARVRTLSAQIQGQSKPVPPPNTLRRQALETLILERLQLQLAEKSGIRMDDQALNEALRRIAAQNKLSLDEFRKVLERDGYDFAAFREDVRRELIVAEVRRRQVENRIQVTDREVDNLLVTAASQADADDEYRLADVLFPTPEGASDRQVDAARTRAEALVEEARKGTDLAQAVAARAEDEDRPQARDLGWRRLSQLPGAVADAAIRLKPGQVSEVIRGSEGFHVVKLLDVRRSQRLVVTQTHARHILLRPEQGRSEDEVRNRLQQLRRRIEGGDDFAALARAHSADSASAARGGDLGWLSPGDVVPEFERAMASLGPGELSEPVRTPFGWHLVQVLERRQHDSTDEVRRARAREVIRQRKLEEETQTWMRRLRDEAYVEVRPEE